LAAVDATSVVYALSIATAVQSVPAAAGTDWLFSKGAGQRHDERA
jgi:hypothetical protein